MTCQERRCLSCPILSLKGVWFLFYIPNRAFWNLQAFIQPLLKLCFPLPRLICAGRLPKIVAQTLWSPELYFENHENEPVWKALPELWGWFEQRKVNNWFLKDTQKPVCTLADGIQLICVFIFVIINTFVTLINWVVLCRLYTIYLFRYTCPCQVTKPAGHRYTIIDWERLGLENIILNKI